LRYGSDYEYAWPDAIQIKYVHKQSKMESQRNVAYIKNRKNAIDINITQMMVGKQWVKR